MAIERSGIRLTFHSQHRPLEAYIQALAAAGLLTETIREVRPPAQLIAQDPAAGRWQRIPLFLHLRAIKQQRPAAWNRRRFRSCHSNPLTCSTGFSDSEPQAGR
jgi:hypothetical protein